MIRRKDLIMPAVCLEAAASILRGKRLRRKRTLKKVVLKDEYGPVNFYLLPFLKPGYVRLLCENETPGSYTEAVDAVLRREDIDFSERNVLVSHQFYTGNGETPERVIQNFSVSAELIM